MCLITTVTIVSVVNYFKNNFFLFFSINYSEHHTIKSIFTYVHNNIIIYIFLICTGIIIIGDPQMFWCSSIIILLKQWPRWDKFISIHGPSHNCANMKLQTYNYNVTCPYYIIVILCHRCTRDWHFFISQMCDTRYELSTCIIVKIHNNCLHSTGKNNIIVLSWKYYVWLLRGNNYNNTTLT